MTKKFFIKTKFIIIPFICVLVCCILYNIFDHFFNGLILDWLDSTFIYENTDSADRYVQSVNWGAVKTYILEMAIIGSVLLSFLIMFILKMNNKKNAAADSHTISDYLNRYILHNEPLPVDIPQEYAEVFAKISEIKLEVSRNRETLLEESTRKNDLVTYIAHDLKTPLTSVIGYLTLLNDENDISEDKRLQYISVALNKAERMEELTNELFEITRFNITEIELQTEKVNLSKMLEQIVYEFKPLLTDKNLNFKSDIEPDVYIIFDIDKLERVIDNLIRNAVNYSYPDSDILISMHRKASDIVLQFQNKGKTIPKDKLSRIFEQFYRLDYSRSTSTGGSGLGLAIAKKIIEAGGGEITAESCDETITFTVHLPECHKIV